MQFRLALAAFALTALLAQTAGAQTGLLYCDPLRVYYPAVPTCPVPWRAIAPPPPAYAAAPPQPIAAQPPADPVNASQTDAYRQGGEDWRDLHAWFGSQTVGRRVGADFWAANRSVAAHASCVAAASGDKFEFVAGCEEAKRKLAPIDDRRRNSPEYRAGFADAAKQLPIELASASTKPASFAPLGDGLDDLCKTVTLPRTIALCGDRELRALAVERQQAFDEARARVTPVQQKALLADQKEWTGSYSQACGLAQDDPPSFPLAQNSPAMYGGGRASTHRVFAGVWQTATSGNDVL